ncbi:Uncharacterised protein [Mycobacteroides abscessus subsp. abscessus]|nr:Uncharacterised protein [Mycobacteroides abscessus subsp. abscessus]
MISGLKVPSCWNDQIAPAAEITTSGRSGLGGGSSYQDDLRCAAIEFSP